MMDLLNETRDTRLDPDLITYIVRRSLRTFPFSILLYFNPTVYIPRSYIRILSRFTITVPTEVCFT